MIDVKEQQQNLEQQGQNQNQNEIKCYFMYATLKPGHTYIPWNKLVYNEKFQIKYQKARLNDFQVYFSYHSLLIKEEGQYVDGFMIQTKEELWPELVLVIEEIEEGYRKEIVDIILEDGSIVKAYTHIMDETTYSHEGLIKIGSNYQVKDLEEYESLKKQYYANLKK